MSKAKSYCAWVSLVTVLTACTPRISEERSERTTEVTSSQEFPAAAQIPHGQSGTKETPPQGPMGGAYIARGNEPFWAIEADGASLTPENQKGTQLRAERRVTDKDVEFHGRDGDRAFRLLIQPTPCQDSMSGQAFEFTATWTYDGQTHGGCAQRRR